MDFERIEVEIANHSDILSLHLKQLERFADRGDANQKMRAAKTVNVMSARTIGLAKKATRVSQMYPGLS